MEDNVVIIEMGNVYSKIIGATGQLITAIYNELSCSVQNYWFSSAYKSGRWDGKQRFFSKQTKKFPTGLITMVIPVLEAFEVQYNIIDIRANRKYQLPEANFDKIQLSDQKELRAYQVAAVNTVVNNQVEGISFQRGIINIATNGGKAQPLYSKVLTPKGFVTMGEIHKGDKVIGKDGKPHEVLEVFNHASKPIYEVTLNDGSKTRCCDEHLWAVQNDTDITKNRYQVKQLSDIMQNLTYGKKDVRPNWSIPIVEPVEFEYKEVFIDPWLLGFLIGDGGFTSGNITFSTSEIDILDKVTKIVESYGDEVKQHSCDNYCNFRIIGNNLRKRLNQYELLNKYSYEKFVPKDYLINSFSIRLELLRGLNDSDGYVDEDKSGYVEYSTTSVALAENVKFLVESMGGSAFICSHIGKYTTKDSKHVIETRTQYCVGEKLFNRDVIPVSSNKHCSKYTPRKKGCYKYIINVEYIGREPAKCIYIDSGDHLYITDNFIVTHNTVIAEAIIRHVYPLLKGKNMLLFVTHSKEIAYQAKKSFETDLGIPVGLIGDNKWQTEKVTIALVSTLYSRMKRKHPTFDEVSKNTVGFIGDEIHHSSSNSWYEVLEKCENSIIRLGLTGTVDDDVPEKKMRLFSVTGSILVKITNDYLIQHGYSAKPECKLVPIDYPDIDNNMRYYGQHGEAGELSYQDVYQKGIVKNDYRNYLIAKICQKEVVEHKGQVLVLVEHIGHGTSVADMIDIINPDIRHIFLYGELKSEERQTGLELLKSGDVDVVISTAILDEGVDVPNINAVVYARGGKSIRKLLQGIGRGLRRKEDGSTLRFYDFIDNTSGYLLKHSISRYKTLKKERFEIKKLDIAEDLGYTEQENLYFMENYDTAFDDEVFVYVSEV